MNQHTTSEKAHRGVANIVPPARFRSSTSTSSGGATQRRSRAASAGTKAGTGTGIRTGGVPAGGVPVRRQQMRPWIVEKIEGGSVGGLRWVDATRGRFRVPWKHGSSHGWKQDVDACIFMQWAIHSGRYSPDEPPNPKRWKANFRCAINSLPDVRELKTESLTRGQNAYRVYEFKTERTPRSNTASRPNVGSRSTVVTDDASSTTGPASATLGHASAATGHFQTSRSTASLSHASPSHASPSHASPSHASTGQYSPNHASPSYVTPSHTSQSHASQSHTSTEQSSPSHASQSQASQSHTSQSHASQSHASQSHTSQSHASTGQYSPNHAFPSHASSVSDGECGPSIFSPKPEEPTDAIFVTIEPTSGSHSPCDTASLTGYQTASPSPTNTASFNIADDWSFHSGAPGYWPPAYQQAANTPLPAADDTWPDDVTATSRDLPADVTKVEQDVSDIITLPATFPVSPISSPALSFTSQTPFVTQSFHTVTSETSIPVKSSKSPSAPQMTLDLTVTHHVDYDSGIGSPSSTGSSAAHSNMDFNNLDDSSNTSDTSRQLSDTDWQEIMETLEADQWMTMCNDAYGQSSQQQQQTSPNTPPLPPSPTDSLPYASHCTQAPDYREIHTPDMCMEIEYLITIKGLAGDPYSSTIDSSVSTQLQPLFET